METLKAQHGPTVRRGYRFRWFRLFIVTLVLTAIVEGAIFIGQRVFLRKTVADWGVIEHQAPAEVLFLRKEKVLMAPFSGRVYPAVKAGSRVRRGTVVAEIIDLQMENEISLEERRNLIKDYSTMAEVEANIEGVQNELQERRAQLLYLRRRNDVSGQLQVEREIARLSSERAELIEERSKQRRAIEERTHAALNRRYTCLVAEEPGVFWPALDGGEALPNGEGYVPASEDFHRNFRAYAPVLDRTIEAGRPVGKLITGWDETVVAWVRPNAADFRPEPGWRCRLLLSDGTRAEIEFAFKADAAKGEYWVFRESSLDTQLLQKRRVRAMVLVEKTKGVRLPKTALWRRKNGFVVLTPDKSRHKELPVTLIDANEQWAVVKGIEVGTLLLYR